MKAILAILSLLCISLSAGAESSRATAAVEQKTVSCHLKRWMEEHWLPGNIYDLKIDEYGRILSPPEPGAKQVPRQSDAELARFEMASGEGHFIIWSPTSADRAQGVFRMEIYLKASPAHAAFGAYCLKDSAAEVDLQELQANWTCEAHDFYRNRMVEGQGLTSAIASNDLNHKCGTSCDYLFCRADKYFNTFVGFQIAIDRNGVQRCYRRDSNRALIGTDQNYVDNTFCQYEK